MRLFKTNKVLTRLTKMVDNAIDGKAIENGFDETKMSALETKLSNFLTATSTTKIQLAEEKTRINELISDISHQTKTPITNLLLYTQLLSERDLDPQDKECVLAIEQQAKKLEFLVNALVKTSRLENGIIVTTPKLSKVDELVEVVNAQVIPKAKEKGISLTTKECGLEALFDPKWVAEALYNIADNAIKYTPDGGKVSIKIMEYQMFVRIDVIDTGIGMTEEEIPKIFARFYRSSNVCEQDGVGIGLYLARQIITVQGGYIKVSSKPGKGSTFSIFLPMSK